MKVLVAGSTGVVGRCLVPMLVERGHEVYGTTTRKDKLEQIAGLGAAALLVDGLDAESISQAVRQSKPEAILHEMTALNGKPDFKHFERWFAQTNELRTQGTANLLTAAHETGTVQRIVVQSYTGWTSADSGAGLATEDEPFDSTPLPEQRTTLDAIRWMERAVLDAPIDAVVLRYANLYSAESMETSIAMLRKRQFPIVGSGAGVWSWLHARDAAAATVVALERARPGVYNVADDDPAPVNVWLAYLAEVVAAPKPMRVPGWLAKMLIGAAGVRMMTRVRGVSNAKIKNELGWRPTYASWRDGFATFADTGVRAELARATG